MKALVFDNQTRDWLNDHHGSELRKYHIEILYGDIQEINFNSEVEILIGSRVSLEILAYYPNTKLIMVPASGLNHIDLEEMGRKNIIVKNTTVHSPFVAERGIALLMALKGNVVRYHSNLKEQYWSNLWCRSREGDEITWTTMFNKKVAIYGYGIIGETMARLLEPYNPKVGILNYKNRSYDQVQLFDDLEALAEWCDMMLIAAPLNEETKDSINRNVLAKLKGKFLVNVGRGPIVNEEALYNALKDSTLAGYASDVWYQYPTQEQPDTSVSKYPIHEFENVVMTPHCGGAEATSRKLILEDVVAQMADFVTNHNL